MTRSRLRSTFTSCTPLIFIRVGRSLRTHSSQSSPSVAISIVSKIAWSARSWKKGSAGSGSFGRAGSIVFIYLTCDTRAAVASDAVAVAIDLNSRKLSESIAPWAVRVNRPCFVRLPAQSVQAPARRSPPEFFGQQRWDGCRLANLARDPQRHRRGDTALTLPRSFPQDQRTSFRMQKRSRLPHNWAPAFPRSLRAPPDFALSPCR